MRTLHLPEFSSFEEEASFWDNLDTADLMADDGQWFRFDTNKVIRVAILPDIAEELTKKANEQGISIETLVNVLLSEHISESVT